MVKFKGIDGRLHKRWSMWFNSIIRTEPYQLLLTIYENLNTEQALAISFLLIIYIHIYVHIYIKRVCLCDHCLPATTSVEAECLIHSTLIGSADGRLTLEGLFLNVVVAELRGFTTIITPMQ